MADSTVVIGLVDAAVPLLELAGGEVHAAGAACQEEEGAVVRNDGQARRTAARIEPDLR